MAGETDNIGSADVISSAPLSAPVIVSQVIAALEEGKPDTVLEYEGVSPSVSSEVLLTLDTISDGSYEGSYRATYNSYTRGLDFALMPSLTHDIAASWLDSELHRMGATHFLRVSEIDTITACSRSRFRGFGGLYSQSTKEPDWYIWPRDTQPLPSLALECARSERRPKLERDRDLWLLGGHPHLLKVFIVDLKPVSAGSNRVRGVVELWVLANGQPTMLQSETIFPAPANSAAQQILLARGDILGASLPHGRSGAATVALKIDRLRNIARAHLARDGKQPA